MLTPYLAGNYLIRYIFSAAGTAVCLPAINAMGVGWFSTISTGFLIFSAGTVYATTIWGEKWREAYNRKQEWRSEQRQEKARTHESHVKEKRKEQLAAKEIGNREAV